MEDKSLNNNNVFVVFLFVFLLLAINYISYMLESLTFYFQRYWPRAWGAATGQIEREKPFLSW